MGECRDIEAGRHTFLKENTKYEKCIDEYEQDRNFPIGTSHKKSIYIYLD